MVSSSDADLSKSALTDHARPSLRLDKYLWHARFFKSRSQAASFIVEGRLRIDGVTVAKANHAVRIGSVLTFPLGPRIRVVRVLTLGTRRGPATEARALYEDLEARPQAGNALIASRE